MTLPLAAISEGWLIAIFSAVAGVLSVLVGSLMAAARSRDERINKLDVERACHGVKIAAVEDNVKAFATSLQSATALNYEMQRMNQDTLRSIEAVMVTNGDLDRLEKIRREARDA